MIERTIRVDSSLGPDVFQLRSLVGKEELGRPFELTLELHTADPSLKLTDLLGQTMSVTMPLDDGSERHFHGYIVEFTETGPRGFVQTYRAQLKPWFALMGFNSNCRIFQNKSVIEIADELFADNGFADVKKALMVRSYRKLEYSVQYRESDFAFLSRLFEQEGVYYFFEHDKDKHTLVLADAPESHDERDLGDQTYMSSSGAQTFIAPHIDSWCALQRMLPGSYVTDDYDFRRPRAFLGAKLAAPKPHARAEPEIYDFPGEYETSEEGETLAQVRLHQIHAKFERLAASGNVRTLAPGWVFALKEHPREGQNREYLIVEVNYSIQVAEYESGEGGAGPEFNASLEVMPRGTPFHSQFEAPRPFIPGHQTATVVGKAGEEIWTDEHGRVKVQFQWDRRGESNENSSCWVRVAQVWAGNSWGAIHVPRIGQEVLVSFLNGDPDRPLITGRVYNGAAMPPFALPAKAMVSGVKSDSTPGGGGYNEISMDDTKGTEKIVVHGQFDMESTIEHDKTLTVHNNRTSTIDVDDTETVGNNQTITIGVDQSVTIGGTSTDTIALSKTLTIGTAYQVTVGADMNEAVAGLKAEVVGTSKSLVVGEASTEHVKGSKSVKSDKGIKEEATDEISMKSGKKMTLTAGDDFAVSGKKKGVIEIADELTLKVGKATITLKKSGDIIINGKKISVTGSGDVVLKGTKIAQN
ncbi:MAG: hypothetical protein RLZZ450_6268 [Pseudomonadota bacterium]|jgi:type VI secretion system secreted protein VgrG